VTAKTRPFQRGDRIALHIDRLATGGRGVGRFQGMVVFVSGVAPLEDVEVEITFIKKNFAEAKLLRILVASEFRITPPCPVAGKCGGCSWQHVTYAEQLRQKKSQVIEALRKFSGYALEAIPQVAETQPSPLEFRYRNRIQLHNQGSRMGFHQRDSHSIVDIDDCLIAEQRLTREIPELKAKFANTKASRIELFLTQEMNVAVRTPDGDDEGAGSAFSQVNTSQNLNLVNTTVAIARTELEGLADVLIYDLYSGSGNFTLPLAKALPNAILIGVESNPSSVERGQQLTQSAPQISFVAQNVHDFLQSRPQAEIPTFILLDPPRTGCGTEVMNLIVERGVERILYISCHPVTLARDLQALAAANYKLHSVQPFDMFPQTDHVEVVAYLTK